MQFRLCYIDYEFKPTLKALKEFHAATKKCLWTTVIQYNGTYYRNREQSFDMLSSELAKILTFNEAAQLFHCLGKQANSLLSLDEIEDAMFHAGMIPIDGMKPWQIVAVELCSDVQQYIQQVASEKKSLADS